MKSVTTFIFVIFSCITLSAQDTQKPVVTSFGFTPTSVDVTSGSANLTFNANITDNSSGVFLVIVTIRLANNSPLSGNATLTSGSTLNGNWQVNFVVPQNSPAGTGMLFQMTVFDNSFNSISFPSPEFPTGTPTFTVVNTNVPDNVAPSLVSFSIDPTTVDVTLSPKIVKITANLTDNLSGVKTVSANVELPNGTVLSSFGSLLLPSAATALNGNWEIEFTIPKFTTPGTANITSLNAVDTSGNSITYSEMSIPALSAISTTGFTIDNGNVDNIAPALTSYTVSPPSVNVTIAAQNVTVRATATDNLAGVKSISVTIQLPNGNFQNANAVYDMTSMSTLNGHWDAVFTIPLQTLPGLGRIIQIALIDSANVNRAYSLQAMTLQGPDFTIVNESVLPVEWLKPVTASIQNRHAMVEWSAGSQINNEKFVIQHSNNGIEFYKVGEQKGEVNSSETKIYSFIHEFPEFGMNYYRIKQMDYDGKLSYSNIASVSYNLRDLIIYPNPVRNELTITSTYEDIVQIYDVYGRLFKSKTIQAGQNKISMSELPSGTYIIALQNGERYKILKE